jgi:quercetin dioxygenase-like cupin family protein
MYRINSAIIETECIGLKATKLMGIESKETLLIALEKGKIVPDHASPKDASIIVLSGAIVFNINESKYLLQEHQTFNFPKLTKHWVEALEDSKFLLLR